MARISQETIDRVRNAADILDVVSQYVDLKKRGRNYFGVCPFHHEKTASFSVAPEKEIFHCFGCGKGGNAINFVMEYEKIEFVDAIKKLGQRYGVEVKMEGGSPGSTELRSRLYQIHEYAQSLYQNNLYKNTGKAALDYLKKRGFSEDILREFGVGFATDSFENLYLNVREKGFTAEEIGKSGLFSQTEKGVFDRFRNRIMFPIFDRTGKIVAFGGRTLSKDDPAKYLNSPETQLYRKSDVFYGLHATRKKINEAGVALLVEGYTDFLRLYEAGIQNVIAVSGTALTERHVQQLSKFISTVVVLYDGDTAGTSAAIRAAYLLLEGGLEPKILQPPDQTDPDDWVREAGADTVRQKIDKAENVILFQVRTTKTLEKSVHEQSQLADDILRQLTRIKDTLVRTSMIRELSQTMGIAEEDLVKRFQGFLRRARGKGYGGNDPMPDERIRFTTRTQKAQLELIKILAGNDIESRDAAKDKIHLEWFSDPFLKKLAKALLPIYEKSIPYASILDTFTSKQEHQAVSEIFTTIQENQDPNRILEECTRILQIEPLREKIKQLRLEIRAKEQAGEDATSLAVEVAQIQQDMKALT